jgi:hypothetical protein
MNFRPGVVASVFCSLLLSHFQVFSWAICFQIFAINFFLRTVLRCQNHWIPWLCPSSGIPNIRTCNCKTQCFGNWISCCLQVRGGRHLLCWIPYKVLTLIYCILASCYIRLTPNICVLHWRTKEQIFSVNLNHWPQQSQSPVTEISSF